MTLCKYNYIIWANTQLSWISADVFICHEWIFSWLYAQHNLILFLFLKRKKNLFYLVTFVWKKKQTKKHQHSNITIYIAWSKCINSHLAGDILIRAINSTRCARESSVKTGFGCIYCRVSLSRSEIINCIKKSCVCVCVERERER